MLWSQAHSLRQQSKLAISLGWIGGYVNSVGLLVCHVTVSHVTGTTTWFGEAVSAGDWKSMLFLSLLIGSFGLGAMLSGLMVQSAKRQRKRSRYIGPLALEAVLLALFAMGIFLLQHGSIPSGRASAGFILASGLMAMGLQNATITRISGNVVRTTHLTGVVTDLGMEFAELAYYLRDKLGWKRKWKNDRRPWQRWRRVYQVLRRQCAFQRIALLGSLFISFLLGVIFASVFFHRIGAIALALPIAFLIFMIAMDYLQPIASTREIDRLADTELKLLGIHPQWIGAGVGIYRVSADVPHHTVEPDFLHWVETIKPTHRTVILALTPEIHFSRNAVLDLHAAIDLLTGSDRRLILSGITPSQYRLFESQGTIDKIGASNLCPDLEFAIAAAINVPSMS